MNHFSEEDLILHYYREEGGPLEAERHMTECAECRSLYASLRSALDAVDRIPAPQRDADYGARVWQRIEGRLESRPKLWFWSYPWRWAAAGVAFAGLLAAAFLAGRFLPGRPAPAVAMDSQVRERILLVAVGDCLERSQMVLIELANANANASGGLDISAEQSRAGDLVSETRLYRQTAARTGDGAVVGLLEELERVLVDITHQPSHLSPEALDKLRERLQSEGIVFKMRVLGAKLRREEAPDEPPARQRL
jgi:hypothetical protein